MSFHQSGQYLNKSHSTTQIPNVIQILSSFLDFLYAEGQTGKFFVCFHFKEPKIDKTAVRCSLVTSTKNYYSTSVSHTIALLLNNESAIPDLPNEIQSHYCAALRLVRCLTDLNIQHTKLVVWLSLKPPTSSGHYSSTGCRIDVKGESSQKKAF